MITKLVFPNLYNLKILYQFKLSHLLNHCINSRKDFFDEIKFSYKYFDYKILLYELSIVKIIVYYKIIEKKLGDKYEICINKNCIV